MKRFTVLTFFLCLGVLDLRPAMPQENPDPDRIEALAKAASPEVGQFLARKLECFHWAGEEAYDKARAREIRRAFQRLQCDALEKDEAKLRKSFAPHAPSMEALDAARDL
jgi:hypothetical protein